MYKRRSGFTLIELLVVIAIIGILAAMLFPVFARARESARKTQCLANVKNIAMAYQIYLTDYDRFPPKETNAEAIAYFDGAPGGFGSFDANGNCIRTSFANPYLRWPVILDEYIKSRQVWNCPSAKRVGSASWIVGAGDGNWLRYLQQTEGTWGRADSSRCSGGPCCVAWPPGWGGAVTDSVLQGIRADDDTNAFKYGIGDVGHPAPGLSNGPHNCGLSTSSIEDPSWFVVCGDSLWNDIEYPSATAYPELCGTIGICGGECSEEIHFWDDPQIRKNYTRHLGGSNLGFADGHAKWFAAEAIMNESPTTKDPTAGHLRGIGVQLFPVDWEGYCP